MLLITADPQLAAEFERAWSAHREALRRVNQDWAVWGAVERTNGERLESARRALSRLGVRVGL